MHGRVHWSGDMIVMQVGKHKDFVNLEEQYRRHLAEEATRWYIYHLHKRVDRNTHINHQFPHRHSIVHPNCLSAQAQEYNFPGRTRTCLLMMERWDGG
jgi:hypothetical protein